MGEADIIEIILTLKSFGIGFVFQPKRKNYVLYLGFFSICINIVQKADANKWISFFFAD